MEKPAYPGGMFFRLVLIWLAIILLGAFSLTIKGAGEPARVTVVPETPRKDEPVLATFQLSNPCSVTLVTRYRFFAGEKLFQEGWTAIPPFSTKYYQYVYSSPVETGERVSFAVKTFSDRGNYEQVVSVPPFPPQVCSSFISFASFSTTVMSSLATTAYYKDNFAAPGGVNTGLVISLCLIGLLIFLELAEAATGGAEQDPSGLTGGKSVLERFKSRFSILTWILLIIFMGIVYTKVVFILGTG